jgi:hypothetical protein
MTTPIPRKPWLPVLLGLVIAVSALLIMPPRADANCGKTVIDQYFSTGQIKYHPQDCYALALKQIDPDARMYSGIMAAIRAARARDRARDTRAAQPEPVEVTRDPAEPIADWEPVENIVEPIGTVDELTEAARTMPETTTAETLTAETTAISAPDYEEPAMTPLAVLMLGGLASLATVSGLVGVAVRRLTGQI